MHRIAIKNLHVHVGQTPQIPLGLIAGVLAAPKPAEASNTDEISNKAPKIGEQWPGLDAIYAGVSRGEDGQPDAHLILWNAKPSGNLNWKDALTWGAGIDTVIESHVPTRFESALLYASLRDQFKLDRWYWTSTQCSADYAYGQDFSNGYQITSGVTAERRVRAVSRLSL